MFPVIAFSVFGRPATQGSKVPVIIRRKGGAPVIGRNGQPIVRTIDDNPRLSDWRRQVSATAREHFTDELFTGAVSLALTFHRPRPKSHYRTGRHAGELRPDAPAYPTSKPDTIKLARAIEDALTGIVWQDDSQVVDHVLRKRWGPCYQIDVVISERKARPANGTPQKELFS